eukprot:1564396-Amphidinium_carterae.1
MLMWWVARNDHICGTLENKSKSLRKTAAIDSWTEMMRSDLAQKTGPELTTRIIHYRWSLGNIHPSVISNVEYGEDVFLL